MAFQARQTINIPDIQINCFIAIGNPGAAYEGTYHNAGMLAIHSIVQALFAGEEPSWKERGSFAYVKKNGITIVRSLVFMNESGTAVADAARFLKIKLDKALIIHDDSDIALGSLKFSFGRGSAGHKGITSIIKHVRSKEFWRLRIGIRTTPGKAELFVLKKITPRDKKILQLSIGRFTEKLILKNMPVGRV